MSLVTIITDFGTRDGFTTSLKGTIYSARSTFNVVDLIHDIEPYDIVVGAMFLNQALRHFPVGSIHVAAVDLLYEEFGSLLVGRKNGHTVIAPNNGMLSLLGFDDTDEVYLSEFVYEGFDAYLRGVKNALDVIIGEQELSSVGTLYPGHKRRFDLQATIHPNQIKASVVHIDRFENAVLNVDNQLFEQHQKGRNFSIFYKRNDPITKISTSYGSVDVGDAACIINSYGLLEIGINKGKAHSLLGIGKEDAIIIEFNEL